MSKVRKAGRLTGKLAVAVALALGGGAVVSSSAFAALTTVATASNTVEAGTLVVEQAAVGGSVGISGTIGNISAGDKANRYIDLTNSGSLDGVSPTLQLADDGTSTLTNQTGLGLFVTIQECSVAWTVATGVCGGATTTALVETSVKDLKDAAKSLTLISTQSGAASHLQASFRIARDTGSAIVDYEETTVDGKFYDTQSPGEKLTWNPDFTGSSIQGKSASIDWVFQLEQATGATTNG